MKDDLQKQTEEITVDLPEGGLSDYKPPEHPVPHKEVAASWVAKGIVIIFGISLGIVLIGGFVLIAFRCSSPADPKALVSDSIIPLIEKAATFATTVFGPLLAFVLGYYFAERQKH
jgi:hypothetical protein